METINDIVREIATEMLNTSMQDITAERIHGWATRLGATCKDSLQVGNAAKMREALEWLLGFGYTTSDDNGFHMPDAKMAKNKIEEALSAPARNCDICRNTHEAVGRFVAERNPTKVRFEEFAFWLFAEAKGENND